MNYSFRKKNKTVKYVIIHYTGMKNLELAFKKLNSLNSDVSCHYLISRDGKIFNLLCPSLKAWHAGISKWGKTLNLNDESIGIELENKGHDFGYQFFTDAQYRSLKKLYNFLKNNYFIHKNNFLTHSDIAPNRKKDPGERFYFNKFNLIKDKILAKDSKKKLKNIEYLLKIYGFHKTYIKNNRNDCIKAVKRTLNYNSKKINSDINQVFLKDFYNLIFK